jgi:Pyruvate/2-oxoacid:ferredoxin oxidoreductase gamma subunit
MDKTILMEGVEKSIKKYFGKKGEQVVQDNLKAVSLGFDRVITVSEPTLEGELA